MVGAHRGWTCRWTQRKVTNYSQERTVRAQALTLYLILEILLFFRRAKKNKRKVITPDEIDSLFATKKQNDQTAEEEEEEDGNDIGMDQDKMRKVSNQNKANSGSNDVTAVASVPQWIMDAEKAAKKQRGGLKINSKKQRKLTDDWRFWGALIAVAGFASAFASVYQQTGGFGSGTLGGGANELII